MKWLWVIVVPVLSLPLAAKDSIREWRLATKEEKSAVLSEQYAAMAKMHICCDPPCDMGFASGDGDDFYFRNPCELINDKGEWMTLVTIKSRGKECHITGDQADSLDPPGTRSLFGSSTLDAACRNGTLPKLVLK